jgi:serine/threonine protein kinase
MLEIGQSLAQFKILKLLGEGGMGMVYLAEDTKLNRKVALKVLLSETFDNPEHQNRFNREAKTAAQISHGNIMGIYDINTIVDPDTNREICYIVMEYVPGLSLNKYVSNTNLDLSDVVKLAEKISSGLSAAHRLNIVHRDIKAENIIVDEFGEPKILDFGLAKPVTSVIQFEDDDSTKSIETDITRAGKIIGTVSYMSPEQARGEAVDSRSDIFSFGILLYRLVTGELPFSAPTQVSTLAKILESKHGSPRKLKDNIPSELERIIDKCLQKKPDDRYQDTRDLVVDLRNLRKQYDSGMTDSMTVEYSKQQSKEQNYIVRLSGKKSILYSIIAFFAIIILWKYSGDSSSFKSSSVVAQEYAIAILGFENKTGDEELNWLETGLPEILLTDLSQTNQARVISRERIIDCLPPDKRINHTFEECVDAASDLGAVNLLSGSFYKLGDKLRIDARLEEIATGKILVALKVVGDDPFKLVDSLTQKIISTLNFTQGVGNDLDVATFVSDSPVAYKHYMQGIDYFQVRTV